MGPVLVRASFNIYDGCEYPSIASTWSNVIFVVQLEITCKNWRIVEKLYHDKVTVAGDIDRRNTSDSNYSTATLI